MTSQERLLALIAAVRYLCRNNIDGAIAECGVWRGGSMMAAALTLKQEGVLRDLYLYDTFAGMNMPDERDVDCHGIPAHKALASSPDLWCRAGLQQVQDNLNSTGYPPEKIHYIVGEVEKTLPDQLPGPLALLRLDTDWYVSTHHEMRHLYPLLTDGGVLILDDYGHWRGAKMAVDDYFRSHPPAPQLQKIAGCYTGHMATKRD